MNQNIKSAIDKILISKAPGLILKDNKDIDNIRYLRGNYNTFVIKCYNNDVLNYEWYEKLCEVCKSHLDEDVVVVFDNIHNLAAIEQEELLNKLVLSQNNGKKLPQNAKLLFMGDTVSYGNIHPSYFNMCTVVRASYDGEVQVVPNITDEEKKCLEMAITDFNNPILILQEPEKNRSLAYLNNEYKTLIYNCKSTDQIDYLGGDTITGACGYVDDVRRSKTNPFKKEVSSRLVRKTPKWLTDLNKLCLDNPDEKVFMVFNNIDELDFVLIHRLEEIISDDSFINLPKNAQVVFTLNVSKKYERDKDFYKGLFSSCSIVRTNDKDNVSVELCSQHKIDDRISTVLDEVFSTTSAPVFIEQEYRNKDTLKYLKDKYKYFYLNVTGIDEESIYGRFTSKNGKIVNETPTWCKRAREICAENPDKKVLVIFDEIGNMRMGYSRLLSEYTLDDAAKFDLPENAQLVFVKDHIDSRLYDRSIDYREFLENCTVVDVYDKENIQVNYLGGEKTR